MNDRDRAKVDVGSIVHGTFPGSSGKPTRTPHWAIVISDQEEHKDGIARVIGISTKTHTPDKAESDRDVLIEAPRVLGLPKRSYAHCCWIAHVDLNAADTSLHNRKAYSVFLENVLIAANKAIADDSAAQPKDETK